MYDFGFIGCGNMGGALALAVSKTTSNIALCDADESKAQALAKQCNAKVASCDEVAKNAKFVVLGVKPQVVDSAISSIKAIINAREEVVIISMCAGISIAAIKACFGQSVKVIRIMPNTPAKVGEGLILYSTDIEKELVKAFTDGFARAGKTVAIDEAKIDAASALSGCGPAFVYMFIEALADGAVECGLPRDMAEEFAAQTVLGSAKMVQEFSHPATLKDAVCSPGGTTIAGVHALENGKMRGTVMDAVTKAYKRTLELKK